MTHIPPTSVAVPAPSQQPQSQPSTAKRRAHVPTSKTASTKKDRPTLIAKCVEPRPGQTRYWTAEEHERFLEAIAQYGEKAYVAISNYVETRTPKQVRTHAQKFQMKMARLARQSLEAGQPIQMPRGMCPVIEVPVGSKSTIVPISPEQSAKLSARASTAPLDSKTIMSALSNIPIVGKKRCASSKLGGTENGEEQSMESARKMQKRCGSKSDGEDVAIEVKEEETVGSEVGGNSMVAEDSNLMGVSEGGNFVDEDSPVSKITEGGAEYDLECSGVCDSDEMDLESKLAAKLGETLVEVTGANVDVSNGDFLVSERSTNGSCSSVDEDDLEDLDHLEDGDLSLVPFSNASENWLLPDISP